MKRQLMVLLTAVLVFPAMAHETNETGQTVKKKFSEDKNGDKPVRPANKRREERSKWTDEQRNAHMERKFQFMDKALTEIGVSEEDKAKIHALQKLHREQMKAIAERTSTARRKLSELQGSRATEEELYKAIDEVTQAQREQLQLLVRNRLEMEKILGEEKCALLMENARSQFRKKGHPGGEGFPPLPGGEERAKRPPMPPDNAGPARPPAP